MFSRVQVKGVFHFKLQQALTESKTKKKQKTSAVLRVCDFGDGVVLPQHSENEPCRRTEETCHAIQYYSLLLFLIAEISPRKV